MLPVPYSLPHFIWQLPNNDKFFSCLLQLFLGIIVCIMSLHMYFAPPSILIDMPTMLKEESESLIEVSVDRRADSS
jgi:UDP-sugar transporter A1/2/3